MVALPASAASYTCAGSTPPSRQTCSARVASVCEAATWRRPSAAGSSIVALIREITSAPKGCCLLSIEATPTGVPVTRSSRVATTVVVPRSKAMA